MIANFVFGMLFLMLPLAGQTHILQKQEEVKEWVVKADKAQAAIDKKKSIDATVEATHERQRLEYLNYRDQSDSNVGETPLVIIGILFGIPIYFIPTIVAYSNKKQNTGAICALNLLLGWTFVGWVVALVWALTHEDAPKEAV